jgi:pimeloyl-ACP methyl ester carboxylesterase
MHAVKISFCSALLLSLAVNVLAQEGYIDVAGNCRLHYRIIGAGKDTVVVSDVGWQYPYYKKHGKGILYIIYDVRNRAYSDSSNSVGVQQDVEDLEMVRKFFKIKRLNVVGWSYIGGVVALYASEYPEFTRSIIQVGPITIKKSEHFDAYVKSIGDRRSKELDAQLAALKTDSLDAIQQETYCRKFYEASIHSFIYRSSAASELAALVPCDCANEQPDNFKLTVQKTFGKLGDWDWTIRANAVKARALIIHGIADNIPLASSELWASNMKNSRLLTFKSSGHMPFAEEPELYFRSIHQFISKLK